MPALQLKTRFAPSPTGFLHLGHIAHLLYVCGLAARERAQILFRIEDHDQTRCRPEYEEAIIADLKWLGLADPAAEGFDLSHPSRQSTRCSSYEALAKELFDKGLVYGCSCSRKQVALRTHSLQQEGLEIRYDGFCRDRGLPFAGHHGLRLRLPATDVTFVDQRLGPITQNPQTQCGDLQIRERSGLWTYQFAVVADDREASISWIIRGEDILPSTGRQILLAQTLGQTVRPQYFHHPLIVDQSGRKLAKRDRDFAITQRRLRGESPNAILGEAAFAVGLLDHPRDLELIELPNLFKAH